MGFDTSTLTRHVSTVHTVDENGNAVDLVESTHARYSCAPHGMGWNSWEDAREHLERFHNDQSSGTNGATPIDHGGQPAEVPEVSEGVAVGLEPPSE